MRLYSYQEIETEVRQSLDIINSDSTNFISDAEMVNLYNEALKTAESEILLLNQDQFLVDTLIPTIAGTTSYALPSDIYAQKIRALIYSNGSKIYPIKRIKDLHKFYKKAEIDHYSTGETELSYILKSGTAGAQNTIELSPPSAVETGSFITCWHIRDANRVPLIGEVINSVATTRAIQLATVCDLPEWKDYIVQFIRVRVYDKELDPRVVTAAGALDVIKGNMISALANQIIDNDDTIVPDTEIYYDHN